MPTSMNTEKQNLQIPLRVRVLRHAEVVKGVGTCSAVPVKGTEVH